MEKIQDGDVIVYHDTHGTPHNALVTNAWGGVLDGAVNLAYVSDDKNETDPYGQQLKRESSVSHVSKTNVFGRYWRRVNEEPRPMKVDPA